MNELQALAQIGKPSILVLGDLILDRYTWGNAERVSPEAPVLVLHTDQHEVRLGGAASVAYLLRALEANVLLAGVVGDDGEGRVVRRLLEEVGIDQSLVLTDTSRPTTTKERFLGRAANRHPHQILRVDSEVRDPLKSSLAEQLIERLVSRLSDVQAVLIADYAKGVCTPELLRTVIAAANARGVPVLVDPARGADFRQYAGAELIKPNRLESELAVGRKLVSPCEARGAANELRERCGFPAVVITLDADGLVLVGSDGHSQYVPTRPRAIYDITGAGDMVLAVLGLCLAAPVPLPVAARLANTAAGLEIERWGVAPVTRDELRAAGQASVAPAGATRPQADQRPKTHLMTWSKIVPLEVLLPKAEAARHAGRKIVFTNGCFDLLHAGHVCALEEASRLGDVLIVAVNSDRSVRNLKGASRPLIGEDERARMLAALACVDHVLIFDDPTPHELLRQLRPDVLVKGGTSAEVVGREVVEAYGGIIHVTVAIPGLSTTVIARRMTRAPATSEPQIQEPSHVA